MRLVRHTGGPRPGPPWQVQALRLTLLTQTALTAGLGLLVWRSLQSFAWPEGGVETDLFERGMSYLLLFAPTLPVNLLAVVWLARGGHRARLYLAGAGVLVAVQQILLLAPLDPGGSTQAGTAFALTAGPLAFAGIALTATGRAKDWLRDGPAPSARRVLRLEGLAWALTAVLALGAAASVDRWVAAATETGPPIGEYDESDVWARMEAAVTNTAAGVETFPGFTSRTVEVAYCGYRTDAGLQTYRYRIAYELAPFAEPGGEAAYAAAVRTAWSTDDYRLLHEGDASLTAAREDELTLRLTLGDRAAIELWSGCLERVDALPQCLEPQGGVMPENDTIEGILCPNRD